MSEKHSSVTNTSKLEPLPAETTTTLAKNTTFEAKKDLCDPDTEFECKTRPGDCVTRALLCDEYEDWDDGSDEENCGGKSYEDFLKVILRLFKGG